jgi:hypothetical protein
MKKTLGTFIFITLISSSLFADGGILVGGGMTFSNYSVSDNLKKSQNESGIVGYKLLPGIKLNWNYWYNCNKRIGIITGINFETRGSQVVTTINGITTSTNSKLHYFTIPIYASMTLLPEIIPGVISDFSISAGPEFGFIVRMDNEAPANVINSTDLGASVNCSVALFNTFSIGAGYEWGYANIIKNSKNDTYMKNNAIKIFINYIYRAK